MLLGLLTLSMVVMIFFSPVREGGSGGLLCLVATASPVSLIVAPSFLCSDFFSFLNLPFFLKPSFLFDTFLFFEYLSFF